MLEHPFAAWRVFLHPEQRKIAYQPSYAGPVQVTGGAGTGKTVTALHRAYHLARQYADGKPVLLTTFTRNLAEALSHQLDLLVDDPAVRERIEVVNVDRLANQITAEHEGKNPKIIGDVEAKAHWQSTISSLRLPFSASFLSAEWEQVILAQDIRSLDVYLACKRAGRGMPLSKDQRKQVWQAVNAFTSLLAQDGSRTHLQIAGAATEILAKVADRSYWHVVVDEAQDLHPSKWRLLRAVAGPGPDNLFIVGDPHQRIYHSRVSLAALGIEVRGRSRRLKLNYRTTQEILAWSVPVLGSDSFSSLDGAVDDLTGYRSLLHGRRPEICGLQDRAEELTALVNRVQGWLDQGIEPSAVGVAGRARHLVNAAEKALDKAGISTVPLSDPGNATTAVRIGTMHSMKGLEFRAVAVVGVSANGMPLPAAVTPETEDPIMHAQDLQRERSLLYVACTRARDFLYLSYARDPSPFLSTH